MRTAGDIGTDQTVPTALAALAVLASNMHWSWDRETRQLFEALDPAAWSQTGGDPLQVIRSIAPARWAALATDAAIVSATRAATSRLHDAMAVPSWFQARSDSPLGQVAYFSPEFGISETLPQYSGGLGVLAGDHLKAASDLGLPMVAVGLLYDEGYFHQSLNDDGMQSETYFPLDPRGLALHPTNAQVTVEVGDELVRANVWRVQVGRIPLYLLDTNVEGNSAAAAAITDRLYGGDNEHRLRQEIVLGIGGVRALRMLGLQPDVFHTNEGHAGFLSLERVRELVAEGSTFDDAVAEVRSGGVFTTHTSVPAGIDRFAPELMKKYFAKFAESCGCRLEQLLAVGQHDDELFNMAVMGLRLAGRANGVAQLHGKVSREMFSGLWPDVPVAKVPIGAITNGVHAPTWVGDHIAPLLAGSVGPTWDSADSQAWSGVDQLDEQEVWSARSEGRTALVALVRSRMRDVQLDPDALTIGFARRFATYKRATLLLSQPERLRALLLATDRPLQFVFAGKAHPADQAGKDMIRDLAQFIRKLEVGQSFVFMPDYDMAVARTMYHGCDVWLNTPRRPLEACGTSGMKAALNGALNCSILDGWWDECFDGENGWAIESDDDEPDLRLRDQREATSLFELFEREIVPLFHRRDAAGMPAAWIAKMKHNWRSLGPFVTASRMVRDYTTNAYEPAAADARLTRR
ncbi:MAG: alpha-glucan family phosphorylase [Actinobacteria bacterium]|nr:alpha-glucan family phosphorylase [Actinomycetota bacterium]